MIIIVMGVSGSGKTTLGSALAAALGWTFVEGDELHPPSNVAKMSRGIALDDDDRRPWLLALKAQMRSLDERGDNAVVACSALKKAYRDVLDDGATDTRYVFLHGDHTLLAERMRARRGHFMPAKLLDSQIATLEPPDDAIQVDIALNVEQQVRVVRRALTSD